MKQLYLNLQDSADLASVQSNIEGYDNFFHNSKMHYNIINYESFRNYHNQSFFQKVKKHTKVFFVLIYLIFRNYFSYKSIYIYSHELFVIWFGTKLKLKKLKIIYHQFEMITPPTLNRQDNFFLAGIKKRFTKLDLAIFPEENRKKFFQKLVSPVYNSKQFFLLPNTNNNCQARHYSDEKSPIRITHIGSVGISHHIQNFLTAIKNLPSEKFEIWFVGHLNVEVLDLIKAADLKNVVVTGQIPHSELGEIYQKTDIGVVLYKDVNINNRYCAPNKIYEFWSYGIPVLGDRLPGLISVLKDKDLGILIDFEDIHAVEIAISKMGKLKPIESKKIVRKFRSDFYLDNYLNELKKVFN